MKLKVSISGKQYEVSRNVMDVILKPVDKIVKHYGEMVKLFKVSFDAYMASEDAKQLKEGKEECHGAYIVFKTMQEETAEESHEALKSAYRRFMNRYSIPGIRGGGMQEPTTPVERCATMFEKLDEEEKILFLQVCKESINKLFRPAFPQGEDG